MTKANASRTGYYLKKFLTDNLNLIQGKPHNITGLLIGMQRFYLTMLKL